MLKRRCPECQQKSINVLDLYHGGQWDWPIICHKCNSTFEAAKMQVVDRYIYMYAVIASVTAIALADSWLLAILALVSAAALSLWFRYSIPLRLAGIKKFLKQARK